MGVNTRAMSEPGREFAFTPADFDAIVRRVREHSGIMLGASKRDLVYGRLGRRLRVLGCSSFAEYLDLLDGPHAADEQATLVNAITTNLTSFFREPHHFATLATQVVPEVAAAQPARRRLRIWSAGCSSGEEPYTIAMTVLQALPDVAAWDALVLATDIDTNMIAISEAGAYAAEKADPIPPPLRARYVLPAGEGMVRMAPALQRIIRFRQLNLLSPWPMRGMFDVIFCRNVVIYFDTDTKRALFDRYADMLAPGGWLFIGHSESLHRISTRFRALGRTTYRKLG